MLACLNGRYLHVPYRGRVGRRSISKRKGARKERRKRKKWTEHTDRTSLTYGTVQTDRHYPGSDMVDYNPKRCRAIKYSGVA